MKHPPSVKYAWSFLSELIRKVSDGHCPSGNQAASRTWLALQTWALPVGAQIHPILFACSTDPRIAGGSMGNCSQLSSTNEKPWRGGGKEGPGYFLCALRGLQQWLHLLCGPGPPWNLPEMETLRNPCVWEMPPSPSVLPALSHIPFLLPYTTPHPHPLYTSL